MTALKDEIRTAIRKLNLSKTTGPVSVSVKLLETLEEFGIDKITTLPDEIYDTGQILLHISKFVVIAVSKKPGAT